jgi:hypothetical protein
MALSLLLALQSAELPKQNGTVTPFAMLERQDTKSLLKEEIDAENSLEQESLARSVLLLLHESENPLTDNPE